MPSFGGCANLARSARNGEGVEEQSEVSGDSQMLNKGQSLNNVIYDDICHIIRVEEIS
jgi:hypothetical protein